MAKLRFPNKDTLRCVEHALAATENSMSYGYEGESCPALFFVKDDGIYVMSNGKPRDLLGKPATETRNHCAYAKGYDPRKRDVWDKCRVAVGGDVFSETIELTPEIVKDIREGSDLLIIVSATRLSIATERLVKAGD